MTKIKKLRPTGHRVMVKVDIVEETTKGGIIISAKITDREQFAQVKGTLVAVGPTAWNDSTYSTPWAEVGNRVMFAKHAGGGDIKIGEDIFRIINDEDITAVIEEEEEV